MDVLHAKSAVYFLVLVNALLLLTLGIPKSGGPSSVQLFISALLVVFGVVLQQAAIFWIPAITWYLWILLPSERKSLRITLWLVQTIVLIGLFYGVCAWWQDVQTPSDLFGWLTEYARSEHGIAIRFPQVLLQSAIGIVRSLFQTRGIEDLLYAPLYPEQISWLYGAAAAIILGAVAWICRPDRANPSAPFRKNPLAALCVALIASWAVFCVLWEPNNYYWCVDLVPGICLIAVLFKKSGSRSPVFVGALLVTAIGWNVYGNYSVDRYYESGAPSIVLPKILSQLSDRDRFIVLSKSAPNTTDYDLLSDLLAGLHRQNEVILVDDFILKPDGSKTWFQRAESFIDQTLRNGGKVYCMSDLRNPEDYTLTDDVLSADDGKDYEALNTDAIYAQTQTLLNRYQQVPSSFKLGADPFFEIRLR